MPHDLSAASASTPSRRCRSCQRPRSAASACWSRWYRRSGSDDGRSAPASCSAMSSYRIGLAGDHHRQALRAATRPGAQCQLRIEPLGQPRQPPRASALLEEVSLLLGKSASPRPACAARPSPSRSSPMRRRSPDGERAAPAAASVLASIRSATASATARSSLSFREGALGELSPGSAGRNRGSSPPSAAAACRRARHQRCSTTGPPWACGSFLS